MDKKQKHNQIEINKNFAQSIANLASAIVELNEIINNFDKRLSYLEKENPGLILPKGVN